MKILITGGAGFIGRNLARRLIQEGHKITIVDNFFRWGKEEIKLPDIQVIEADICNETVMENAIKNSDLVFHLAGVSQVMESIKSPDLCFKYNIFGTYVVTKLCARYGKKIIFSSSREVYGNAQYLPVDLKHPLKAENPYASSKISGESIIQSFAATSGLNYTIFRISNVTGKGDKGRIVPLFIELAKKGNDLNVYGIEKKIDFIYIDDVIEALVKSINLKENCILNLGSGVGTSIKDAAEIIINLLGSDSVIKFSQNRTGEVDRFCADISATQQKLNWEPRNDFRQAILRIIE